MNRPSINDIDKWLFESMEGTLSPVQEEMLEAFLVENPAYLDEQEIWSEAKVSNDAVVYPNINALIQKPVWQKPVVYIPFAAAILLAGVFAYSTIQSRSTKITEAVKVFEIKNKSILPSGEPTSTKTALNQSLVAETAIGQNTSSISTEKSGGNVKLVEGNQTFRKQAGQSTSSALTKANTGSGNSKESKLNEGVAHLNNTISQNRNTVIVDVNPSQAANENKVKSTNQDLHSSPAKNNSSNGQGEKETLIEKIQSTESVAVNQLTNQASSKNTESAREGSSGTIGNLTPEQYKAMRNESAENGRLILPMDGKRKETRISSNYEATLAKRFKSLGRTVIRMMDNPIALQNSKDMYYHVPYMQSLDANFASSGSKIAPRVQTVSRAQWLGQENQQIMNQLSFDAYIKSLRGGIGVQLNQQYYGKGSYQIGQMALTYSPKIGVSKNVVLEPAIRLKVGDKNLSTASLTPGQGLELDRQNARVFFPEGSESVGSNLWYRDLGVGLLANTKWFYAGVQVDNLTKHYDNVYNNQTVGGRRASAHFTATLGTDYVSRNKNISFSPYFLYQKMENLSEIWGGSIFRYKKLTIGGGVSSYGDYAGSIGLKTNRFMLTYNADVTTSVLFHEQFLSHQLSLRLLIKNGQNGQKMLKP